MIRERSGLRPRQTADKARVKRALLNRLALRLLAGSGLGLGRQAALVTGGLVAVDEAFGGHRINDRLRRLYAATSGLGVAAGSCFGGLADGRAQARAQGYVGDTVLDRLPGCFFC